MPELAANFLCGLSFEKKVCTSLVIKPTYDRKAEVVRPNLTNYGLNQL